MIKRLKYKIEHSDFLELSDSNLTTANNCEYLLVDIDTETGSIIAVNSRLVISDTAIKVSGKEKYIEGFDSSDN